MSTDRDLLAQALDALEDADCQSYTCRGEDYDIERDMCHRCQTVRAIRARLKATSSKCIPDHTLRPAGVNEYITWLRGYVAQGGEITHDYDHPFHSNNWWYAPEGVTIQSDKEYGANNRNVIVAPDKPVHRTNEGGAFNGWAHSKVFLMDNFATNADVVPIYSGPIFDEFRPWKQS